jgi:hypothetical protein
MRPAGGASAFALLAVLLTSPALAAQGVSLKWDHCAANGGAALRTFACDTNAGTETLVCSFVLDAPLPQVTGNEVVIDVLTEADPLPAWWQFRDAGTCRTNLLGMNTVANPSDLSCPDWAAGQSIGGVGAYSSELGTVNPALMDRHRRIKIALAVPMEDIADLVAGTEYFSCNVTIDHAKSVGTGSCAGCGGSACLYFMYVNLTRPFGLGDLMLTTPTQPGSNMVQWQGTGADCNVLPTKRSTWGQVKGLYR